MEEKEKETVKPIAHVRLFVVAWDEELVHHVVKEIREDLYNGGYVPLIEISCNASPHSMEVKVYNPSGEVVPLEILDKLKEYKDARF